MNTDDVQISLTDKDYQPIIRNDALMIESTLNGFGYRVRVVDIEVNSDNSIEYQLEIAVGVKIDEIESRMREVALAVASPTGAVRFTAPIPGRSLIGITVPYKNPSKYSYMELPKDQKGIKRIYTVISTALRLIGYIALSSAEKLDPITTKVEAMNKIVEQKAKDDDIFSSDKRRVKDLLPQAISLIEGQDRVSASLLQRRLKIGYALAAMLLDALCEKGYIGEAEGSKPRKVIKFVST